MNLSSKVILIVAALVVLPGSCTVLRDKSTHAFCSRFVLSQMQHDRPIPIRCGVFLGSFVVVSAENDVLISDIRKLELTAIERWLYLPLEVFVGSEAGHDSQPNFRIIEEGWNRFSRTGPDPAGV